ncbi:HD domain-containing phosphohydrolase [candidate division CSSED10-310 bacterium]|uniref:HD domain-containing phosphohydrolase n=1 Tax=candidate division CSSED10-310 bacterium TaxID=2855610 RepID=A0ABV6YT74_UNCC1
MSEPMIKEMYINLFDLLLTMAQATDLVSPKIHNHHLQVAYIVHNLANEMNLSPDKKDDLVVAGALHDIGALSLREKLQILTFEYKETWKHTELAYALLKLFDPLIYVAEIVRYHHCRWDDEETMAGESPDLKLASNILHLADRVAVQINNKQHVLGQVQRIRDRIKIESGKMFMPDLVDTFLQLARKEYFWLNTVSPSLPSILKHHVALKSIKLDMNGLAGLTNLFRKVIDFRSRFTATHSSGVAAVAEAIALKVGFSRRDADKMKIAGFIHDFGKLAVSTEILEKPASLSRSEAYIIRCHTYFTFRILEPIPDLYEITTWGAFHHERLDGTGYPFHLTAQDLSLGSRIMTIADIFTAITEDRPYRKRMPPEKALSNLQRLAARGKIDPGITSLTRKHVEEINQVRLSAQQSATSEYSQLLQLPGPPIP